MRAFQRGKDRLLSPLLRLFEILHITPFFLSFSSAAVAVLGAAFSYSTGNPRYFLLGLLLHISLDGLDGPLARRRPFWEYGALVDASADFVGIVAAAFFLGRFSSLFPSLLTLFVALYLLALALLIIRNYLGQPYLVALRPRFVIYAAIALDLLFNTSTLAWTMWLSLAALIATCTTGTLVLTAHYLRNSK